jgi:hypothetical protein
LLALAPTLLAAFMWGREAIGVELVPRYAKLAEEQVR